jgi:epoxyqueuosine reductase
MTSSISEEIAARARALGFVATGIIAADRCPDAGERLAAWLGDGCHGDMHWMADTAPRRASPQALWPDVRTVIILGFPYTPPLDPLRHLHHRHVGAISVYALGQDYHDLVKRRLKALAQFVAETTGDPLKLFVDTAPVMEKPIAAAAGIGWQGKHSNIVSRKHGNWLFLGEIYTTAELPPLTDAAAVGSCGTCSDCIRACPTGAIVAP